MSEVQLKIIIYGTGDILDSMELCFPIPMIIARDVSSLEYKITNSSKPTESNLKRYFVLILESIEDADDLYIKIEENPQVVSVFHIWNENFIPSFKQTKINYIRKELITLALTYNIIQFLKIEADKQVKLNQIPLSRIYLREAEKIKEWIMSTIRAEPCHILVIPLNTNSTNLIDSIQRIEQYCAKFGYSSAIVRSLDDYIPKSEIYDKLPYGKLVFEYEDPKTICRWLRTLSPIRMYLYGNEQVIPNEWSKLMISNEVDHSFKRIVNDDDWYTFIENESVNDDIKWNFSSKHGRSWQITQLTPIKVHTLEDNIRFRSALRRSNITFHTRKSTVTAQIFEWFDECLQFGYIQHEFKLNRQDKVRSISNGKNGEESGVQSNEFVHLEKVNISFTIDGKNNNSYSMPYSFNQSNELINYYSSKSDRIYIWLDNDLYSIEQRFQSLITPHQWKYFSTVSECQTFILNQQLQYNPTIYLFSTYSQAEQLFTYEHVSRIYVAYLYSNQNELFPKWINSFPIIRGIYRDFDILYEQFYFDVTNNSELLPFHRQQQDNEHPLPISIFDTNVEEFKRHRIILEFLLKSSRTSEAKQEMIDELRRASDESDMILKQIDDFNENYHSNAAIQWYTRDSFLYRAINQTLRGHDIGLILKYRFFIIDLYQQLSELHNQIIYSNNSLEQTILTHYRGQSMSLYETEQFEQHIGGFMLINTFLSTTSSLDIALQFAGGSTLEGITTYKPVLFSIEVDPSIKNTRPYASINLYSAYEEEDEVLFAFGSVFRIEKVDLLSVNDNVQVIHLKMIDESELPQEYTSYDISELIPDEQLIINPVYTLVGLTSLFQANEQCERIKSILEAVDVQFFDNTDDLDNYTKSIKTIQSFIIFIHSQLPIPERYQQTKVISYGENDTHFNDLIYQLLHEMEKNKTLQEHMKDLYMNIANVYCPSNESNFYVQLLLSSTSKKDSEEQLKTRFPASSSVSFYQTAPCINFLQSIINPSKIGNAILILYCDDANTDNLIDQFEQIDSIKHIYICSKNAFNIKLRRIIHGKFQNENDLYTQLYSDNLLNSFIQTNQQIDLHKNKNEVNRYFQQTDQFYKLLKEHQQKNIVE